MIPTRRKEGDGRWTVRWYDAGRGSRRRRRTFDRKQDAEAFITHLRSIRQLGDAFDGGEQSLTAMTDDWLEKHALSKLGPRTLRDYTFVLDAHVIPRLGHLKLREIRVETVQDFRAALEKAGVGRSSVRRSMVVLQAIMQRAVVWGRIPRNPVRDAEKPSSFRQRAVVPLAPATVEVIRDRLTGSGKHGDAALVSVLAYAGLRPQEALALEWRHVGERTLLIEQKNIDGTIVPGQKTRRMFRTVDLVAPLKQDLAEWCLRSGRRAGLVFPNRKAKPWADHDYNNWTRRAWATACKDAGIKARPYDLRHSFASLQIRAGLSIPELAEQLGHSPQMTLGTYAHVFHELRGAERIAMEEQILRARGPKVDPETQAAQS